MDAGGWCISIDFACVLTLLPFLAPPPPPHPTQPNPTRCTNTHPVPRARQILTSLLLNPGDALLVEEYTYPVMIESIAQPKGYRCLPVAIGGWGRWWRGRGER
jgi:hypothetical protein